MVVSGAHEHAFCLDLMFCQWTAGSCATMEKVEDAEGDLEGEEEKLLELFWWNTERFFMPTPCRLQS